MSSSPGWVILGPVNRKLLLPIALVIVFALTRIPGVLPPGFSAAYALIFCAGVYFAGSMAWWLPLSVMLATDIGLNVFIYHTAPLNGYTFFSLLLYAAIIALGRWFKPKMSWLTLVGGGLLGALLFYLLTNTLSWLGEPAYAKTLAGWIQALTTGLPGFPPTWEFFRNTLLSGGLFTGLFVGAMKCLEAMEEAKADAPEAEAEPEAEPEEAKA